MIQDRMCATHHLALTEVVSENCPSFQAQVLGHKSGRELCYAK